MFEAFTIAAAWSALAFGWAAFLYLVAIFAVKAYKYAKDTSIVIALDKQDAEDCDPRSAPLPYNHHKPA